MACAPLWQHTGRLCSINIQAENVTCKLALKDSVYSAEDRVLWYSSQYRDWDVTNGSIAQEASTAFLLIAKTCMQPCHIHTLQLMVCKRTRCTRHSTSCDRFRASAG